jgi:hypothetical protein
MGTVGMEVDPDGDVNQDGATLMIAVTGQGRIFGRRAASAGLIRSVGDARSVTVSSGGSGRDRAADQRQFDPPFAAGLNCRLYTRSDWQHEAANCVILIRYAQAESEART